MEQAPNRASSTSVEGGAETNGVAGDGAAPRSSDGAISLATSVEAEPAPSAAKKRRKRPFRAGVIAAIVALIALLAIVGSVYYYLWVAPYVTTDNAQVDGDQIQINAPATGTLIDWRATQGAQVRAGEVVGRVQMQGSGAQPQQIIHSPSTGTVAVSSVVQGDWVTAGSNLATAYDFNKIYATARVDETDIADVHPGALVDISVDAYPGAPVTGIVQDVQGSSAGEFSLFPQSNSSGNFQKVTQVIPVKIAFTYTGGLYLVPGMNITVHIHKH
ncbi:MAG: HlyD family efflux transporter periplasmic adaptor subunit [Pseudonocardia sp.]|nr:HlyD family efflux transporter periplasmic adaptor subunit [Pseudonocardia sp.]